VSVHHRSVIDSREIAMLTFYFFSKVPFDGNIGDHRKRIHRLGQTGTTSGEHQRRDFGSPVRRPSRSARGQHGRSPFGQSQELVFIRVRLPDEVRGLSTSEFWHPSVIKLRLIASDLWPYNFSNLK